MPFATLKALGFASVYIARRSAASTASLYYALFFLGLYLLAHVVTRIAVPEADPFLLPLAGLLTGIGVTEKYRLDPKRAFRQVLWIVIALALFSAAIFMLHRHFRLLERYKYFLGIATLGLLFLPSLPVVGTSVNGARLWVRAGSFSFERGELAKITLIVFLAGYLREKHFRLRPDWPRRHSAVTQCRRPSAFRATALS